MIANRGASMTEPSPIQIIQTDQALRIEWDNRNAPKDGPMFAVLICSALVWVPMALGSMCVLAASMFPIGMKPISLPLSFLLAMCAGGWFGTLLCAYALAGTRWLEWIEVTPTTVTHGRKGFWAPKPKVYLLKGGAKLFFGQAFDSSINSLILSVGGRWSDNWTMLAWWLAPRLKEQLFLAIGEFAEKHKMPLVLSRDPKS